MVMRMQAASLATLPATRRAELRIGAWQPDEAERANEPDQTRKWCSTPMLDELIVPELP